MSQTDKNALSDEALHWIVRLNSGTSTVEDSRSFASWRARSHAHEQAAREAELLWAEMSELHFDRSTGIVRPGRMPRQRHIPRRAVLRGVALLGGAAAVGSGLWMSGTLRDLTADYASGTASPRTVDLPDGSRIFLNAHSAIDVNFNSGLRQIALLEGQAYFEVAPDSTRPFEVVVDGVSVTALGTAFDVSRNLSQTLAEVAVTEHAVRVASALPGSAVTQNPVNLSEGESLTVDRSGRIGNVTRQSTSVTAAWRSGLYIAEGRSLSDVIAALSAWHGGLIFIRDNALKPLKVNAVLDLKDPDGSLDALQEGLPIEVRRITPYLTVISRR